MYKRLKKVSLKCKMAFDEQFTFAFYKDCNYSIDGAYEKRWKINEVE